ncbi:IclR family transcriptional regulator [Sphingomonas sp. HT-1]|uniref:IclR family transcriptional regulator n=1 Tax=unclassified Sphingomonas TaxID=196159 RepID=UPI000308EA6D|nr:MULTISPECIES: IclR family transcriptional regulator [unclassified Sphingomonas]KTF69984.1 transcriptional regulator, IclR family protein [Sphingomonas sp. WG]
MTDHASTAPADKSPSYAAPALEKAIDVIELLSSEPQGLTISEIAQRLGRSISELFRIIVVLDRRGWLHKDGGSDRYRVTYRVLEIAHRATPAQELTHVATPLMHSLAAATVQSCHLVVVNGTRGLIVARQESPGQTGFAVRLGTEIDLLTSCSGHVLLAAMEPERRATLYPKGLPKGLAARLEVVRAQGHESIPSARMAGVSDMSCPVFGFDGHVVAALTIPFLAAIDDAPHVSHDEALERLKATATAISTALGWFDRVEAPVVPSLSVATPVRRRRAVRVQPA